MAYYMKALSRFPRLSYRYRRAYSNSALVYSEEVLQAKMDGKPVVALESTIITHGMPYPQNLETAVQVENIVRSRGAVPATVAILKGQLTIGLTEQQLEYLAQAKGVVKVSRRDLAPVAAAALDGATTVAGTLVTAGLAGIPVFVTGGIGGVHREGETTLDISADLTELGRSNTLVVCSGVKSILDIGRTLEYLETQGVCVCAFGETDDFPAFYTVKSGNKAPHRVADAQEAAKVLHASHSLQLGSGIVVAVPVPKEHAMDAGIIEGAITKALQVAETKGVRGKEVTPFILAAVADSTKGASLAANIALIKNNARVGADIAVEFKRLTKSVNVSNIGVPSGGNFQNRRHFHSSARRLGKMDEHGGGVPLFGPHRKCGGDVLVIGGSNVDRTYRVKEDQVQLDGSTHACATQVCGGGVGRNMAEALWRLRGGRARLITAIGDDSDGRYLGDIAPGMMLHDCVIPGCRTASYAAVLDSQGECRLGLGDMAIHNHMSPEMINRHKEVLEQAPLVVLDGNVPRATIDHVLRLCKEQNKPVFFEPTDRRKAVKALYGNHRVTFASPNVFELRALANSLQPENVFDGTEIDDILQLTEIVTQCIDFLIVTLGSKGIITAQKIKNNKISAKFYGVKALPKVTNVSGAGDCFASGFMYGFLLGLPESECVSMGFLTAKQALLSESTVPLTLKVTSNIDGALFEKLVNNN